MYLQKTNQSSKFLLQSRQFIVWFSLQHLEITVFRRLYLITNGRNEMTAWPGWCVSLMMLTALLRQCLLLIPLMVVRSEPLMDWAAFTIFCNHLHSWAFKFPKGRDQTGESMLSTVLPTYKCPACVRLCAQMSIWDTRGMDLLAAGIFRHVGIWFTAVFLTSKQFSVQTFLRNGTLPWLGRTCPICGVLTFHPLDHLRTSKDVDTFINVLLSLEKYYIPIFLSTLLHMTIN